MEAFIAFQMLQIIFVTFLVYFPPTGPRNDFLNGWFVVLLRNFLGRKISPRILEGVSLVMESISYLCPLYAKFFVFGHWKNIWLSVLMSLEYHVHNFFWFFNDMPMHRAIFAKRAWVKNFQNIILMRGRVWSFHMTDHWELRIKLGRERRCCLCTVLSLKCFYKCFTDG